MPKKIDQVLSRKEQSQIIRLSYSMRDVYEARLLENVLHIECEIISEDINVKLYPSLKNPYLVRMPSRKVGEIPERVDEDDLYDKRKRHKTEFEGRRWEVVLDEIRMRNHDIDVHKYFLSEVEGYDVGWFISAAHWLKTYGPGFYDLSKEQHEGLGVDFEWKGMERSVGIVAPNREGKRTYYVVVRSEDFSIEERFAQYVGGVFQKDTQKVDFEKAAGVREQLKELCSNYFCILDRRAL